MKYISLLVVSCSILTVVTSSVCFWNSGCPYKYFATKTPYNSIRGDIRDSNIKVKACEPYSIWGLFQNGKRYPSYEEARNMKKAIAIRNYLLSSQTHGNCSLCSQDVENLRGWTIDKMFDKPFELSSEGYQEMAGIGRRLKQAFPNLLTDLKKGQYIFQPSIEQLATDSAKAFVDGLERNLVVEEPNNPFDVTHIYRKCGSNQMDLNLHPEIQEETIQYQKTLEYLALKDRLQRRTGIEYKLSNENITSLYDLCRYSSSGIENKLSPWCALFTTKDLQVLEYIEDLKNYYEDGYGMPVNQIFGRIPLADLFRHFHETKMGKGKEIVAYFTQSKIVSMVYTALGLFKDKDPLSSSRISERNWRSSKIATFSSNLVAVLNRCTINDSFEYNIIFYMNEEPLRSICEEGICSWQEFEEKIKSIVNKSIENCEF